MGRRLARQLLGVWLLGCAALALRFVPSVLAVQPRGEEVFDAIRARDFARAARLARDFLDRNVEGPAGEFLYSFETDPRRAAALEASIERSTVECLAPRGSIFGSGALLQCEPLAPALIGKPIGFYVEVEGAGVVRATVRDSGEVVRHDPPPFRMLGVPGAAGRVRIRLQTKEEGSAAHSEIATFAFEILPPPLHMALDQRLRLAERIAAGDPIVLHYLRAMCFARAQCFGDALFELKWLQAAVPRNDALEVARRECASRVKAFPSLGGI